MTDDPVRNRRPLASRQTGLARRLTEALLRTSVTPDQISLAGILFAAAAGVLLITPSFLTFLLAALLIIRVPLRRYQARGYDMGTDRLRVVRGIMFHSDTVVPFGRIQHIDVNQGPLQRLYDIATLTVHTAGTHNASVHLPGLANADAMAMREEIRSHIKRETL